MSAEVAELRYSLNGISDSQLNVLFSQIESEHNQVIIKRISNPNYSLSSDDIILEGFFSDNFLAGLARAFPPPLSCKILVKDLNLSNLQDYSAITWEDSFMFRSGITLLPISQMKQMIGFDTSSQFLNLLTSTKAGSILKCLLAVKPRGLIAQDGDSIHIVLPAQRIDFTLAWISQLCQEFTSLDWLSGSTGELSEEIVSSIGSINQDEIIQLEHWLKKANQITTQDFEIIFKRALVGLQKI
ncbi:MAG: hypothetical protein ACXAD7_12725 [Candidatus Kariarchaeaceae archaeon]